MQQKPKKYDMENCHVLSFRTIKTTTATITTLPAVVKKISSLRYLQYIFPELAIHLQVDEKYLDSVTNESSHETHATCDKWKNAIDEICLP